jgi:hypothetical protein
MLCSAILCGDIGLLWVVVGCWWDDEIVMVGKARENAISLCASRLNSELIDPESPSFTSQFELLMI